MGGINAFDLGAMSLGLLGVLALSIAGLLRLFQPLAQFAGRLLNCASIGGSLAVLVGLCFVTVRVGFLHGRDDLGLIGDVLIAYFIGAGLGVIVFAVREILHIGESSASV